MPQPDKQKSERPSNRRESSKRNSLVFAAAIGFGGLTATGVGAFAMRHTLYGAETRSLEQLVPKPSPTEIAVLDIGLLFGGVVSTGLGVEMIAQACRLVAKINNKK